jgi:membrane fusion protein (multidrug efflux system)
LQVISEVLVGDNQPVAAGQVIARIDDREYRIGLAKAEADLARAQAALSQAKTMLVQQQAEIQRAEADVADSEAGLTFARQEAARYQNLVNSGSGTVQRKQQADADLRQMQAGHDRAVASLDLARKKVDTLETQRDSAAADLQSATAQLDQARLDLSYTTIEAPIAGIVGDRSLRLGQYVNAGSNLLTIVPTGSGIYLIANFKETQLGRMKAGQAVDVDIDAIDDHRFKGRIESFAPGTGAQFALLPPENATGNFTKIVQRVPVRITLEKDDPLSARLRPGLSVVATVDTRGTATRAAP